MNPSSIKVYHYPKCSTCKKALQFLKGESIDFEEIHIVESPPTKEELIKALEDLGSSRKLFNTSGMVYRELGLKEKLDTLSDSEAVELLASNGMLIKRPLLLKETTTLAGFREKEWMEVLAR